MNQNTFTTTSLSLAAALEVISTAKLEAIDFSSSTGRAEFIFSKVKDPEIDSLVARFWAKDLNVDAFTYFEALRYIKSRLYEEKQR